MEIKRSQQSLEITKVETDRREEVKGLKPVIPNNTKDTVEDATPQFPPTDRWAAETTKQTDSLAEGILLRQTTAARLEQSGVHIRTDEKPIRTKKELGTDEQNAANTTTRDVPGRDSGMNAGTSGPRVPNGAFTGDARSRIDGNSAELRNFLAREGIEGNGNNNTGRPPGGPNSSYIGSGSVGNAFAGGPTGPPSATDAMDSVNQKFEQSRKFGSGANSMQNPTAAFRDDIAAADESSNTGGHTKDMIANGSADEKGEKARVAAGSIAAGVAAIGGPAAALGAGFAIGTGIDLGYEVITGESIGESLAKFNEDGKHARQMALQKKISEAAIEEQKKKAAEEEAKKKAEEAAKKAAEEAAKKAAEEAEKKKAEEAKKKGGTGTDSDQESYEKKKFEEQKKLKSEFFSELGFDPYALPQRPVIQGDIDPAEDQQTASGEYQPGLLQQFGKYGLIGNPGGPGSEPSGGGGSTGLGQRGSNIDYENGSGYMGRQLTNDPEDVDTSGAGNDPLIVVPRDSNEDDEEEDDNNVSTQKKK